MPTERQNKIGELLDRSGFVKVQELADHFHVTTETIRRDLEKLEEDGLARRIRGGAISIQQRVQEESAYQSRQGEHSEEKLAIARLAAGMIHQGDTVILSPGTTSLAVASQLKDKHDVTVITSSLPIAMELADSEGVNVFCLGGFLRAEDYSVAGPMSLDNLRMFNANILVTGIGGITPERGVTDYRLDESSLLRTYIDIVDCVIGVADHSKFDKILRYNICPANRLTHLITDAQARPEQYRPYEESGVQVHIAHLE